MVKCDKNEVLRYLGYNGQEISNDISEIINETMTEAENTATFRYCSFESAAKHTSYGVHLTDCDLLLSGKDISRHLVDCNSAIIFAATLGTDIDRRIRMYESSSLTRAVILDCCASSLIESFCDDVCRGFEEKLTARKLFPSSRYSPGYGDLPLSLQPKMLRALNTQRQIGLTCNEQFLMFPRKSVTAVIGISEKPLTHCSQTGCDICSMNAVCAFRKNK